MVGRLLVFVSCMLLDYAATAARLAGGASLAADGFTMCSNSGDPECCKSRFNINFWVKPGELGTGSFNERDWEWCVNECKSNREVAYCSARVCNSFDPTQDQGLENKTKEEISAMCQRKAAAETICGNLGNDACCELAFNSPIFLEGMPVPTAEDRPIFLKGRMPEPTAEDRPKSCVETCKQREEFPVCTKHVCTSALREKSTPAFQAMVTSILKKCPTLAEAPEESD